jgi:hypothetical protein
VLPSERVFSGLIAFFVASCLARVADAEPTPVRVVEARPNVAVGAFVDLEWRLMGLAGHVSHGPAFAAGATFADGFLRVGLGGLGRPGPLNPATFSVVLPPGTTYKGQRRLELKSDGAMLGVHVAFSQRLPFAEAIALELPITVGYGGFGFYLHGDDRDTPDGRRVSEWEDELFEGKDSFLGMVIDAGLRVGYEPAAIPWLKPYVGAAFTIVPGFETIVRDDYLGVSGVLGLEVGYGI